MTKWRLELIIVIALLCCRLAFGDEVKTHLELSRGMRVVLWESEESYQGKTQADPRLDQPVKFWRAGLTMTEVFAGVKEQTGVEVRFWPPDDINTRIRVNLYLNPKEPPPLRDLMAQLMWVLDCGFAWKEEDGEKVYYLLGTSLGEGAEQKVAIIQEARTQKYERKRAVSRQKAKIKLDEYREALKLSREEAFTRYHDVDDMLLLNMLDPRQRAFTRFVCNLPQTDLDAIFAGERICRYWAEWSDRQQTDLREALDFQDEWLKKGPLRIWVSSGGSAVGMTAEIETTEEFLRDPMHTAWAYDEPMPPKERIALRRQLGETISVEDEWKYIQEYWQKHTADQIAVKEELERARMIAEPKLSAEARGKLSTATLPWNGQSPFPLWAIQEAIAQTTGMNVISDAFLQSERYPYRIQLLDNNCKAEFDAMVARTEKWTNEHKTELEEMYKNKVYKVSELENLRKMSLQISALNWLTCLCYPTTIQTGEIEDYHYNDTGMEWGDAGTFLRFRSARRDIFRASLWPNDVLNLVWNWAEDDITIAEKGTLPQRVKLPFDLHLWSHLAASLSDLHLEFGGKLIYDDPSTPVGLLKEKLILLACGTTVYSKTALRLLATLTESQWKQLWGPGLRWKDLSPYQMKMTYIKDLKRVLLEDKQLKGLTDNYIFVLRPVRGDKDPDKPEIVPPIVLYILELRVKNKELANYGSYFQHTHSDLPPFRKYVDELVIPKDESAVQQ